jgi:2-dehydropantoate 2-reductase
MQNSGLSFLVMGAGAIGGITAAFLKKNGNDVVIICKYPDYASYIKNKGISVSGVMGEFTVTLPAYASAEDVKDQKDVILLATKATDMLEAVKEVLPLLKTGGFIISMQNGICEDAIAEIAGKERVIGCVTGWGATMESRGSLVMTSTGDFILGYPDRKSDEKLEQLAKILSVVVPVRTTDNIMGHLYSKLTINSCITSLGAISGLYLGRMLLNLRIRRIFIGIIREAMNVADSMGIKVEIFGGKLDLRTFQINGGAFQKLKNHLILLVIGFKYRRLKSSSLQSLERGKPTEIDWLNGYITSNGKKYGVEVPLNEIIVSLIHEIEQGRRKTGMKNFDSINFNQLL